VAQRTVESQAEDLIRRTQFYGSAPEAANSAITSARDQAADLAILALWATFERYVIEYLQTGRQLLAAGYPAQYSTKLAEKFESEVEYWRIDDILAHRNTRRPVPTRTEPETAFEVLSALIEQIHATHTPPAEMAEPL